MTSESSETDIIKQSRNRNNSTQSRQNQRMLDLRQRVALQDRIIRSLLSEKDSLTKELDSRLFLVEAQLRHEQKHIEEVLNKKEQLIQFQAVQIHSLKQLLTQTTRDYHSSKRRSMSKRYSVALDEYMKDHCVVSRAFPVMVQAESDKQRDEHRVCSRTRSLPELRIKEIEAQRQSCCYNIYQQRNEYPGLHQSSKNFYEDNIDKQCKDYNHAMTQVVLDEIANRRWSSDCDSEHSDSLDSGISSPSIETKSMHDYIQSNFPAQNMYIRSQTDLHSSPRSRMESSFNKDQAKKLITNDNIMFQNSSHKPRRSSSIGSFIQKTFSSSEKQNNDADNRRHNSFSSVEKTNPLTSNKHLQQKEKFISSANRTFGTNHRSVTKPRDVKFRRLFKFKRRTEEPESSPPENYMTV